MNYGEFFYQMGWGLGTIFGAPFVLLGNFVVGLVIAALVGKQPRKPFLRFFLVCAAAFLILSLFQLWGFAEMLREHTWLTVSERWIAILKAGTGFVYAYLLLVFLLQLGTFLFRRALCSRRLGGCEEGVPLFPFQPLLSVGLSMIGLFIYYVGGAISYVTPINVFDQLTS